MKLLPYLVSWNVCHINFHISWMGMGRWAGDRQTDT